MPTYTLELELFSSYITDVPEFEIWADGVLLGSSYSVTSGGYSISVSPSYGGSIPSSLEFRFTDASPETPRTIEVRSVKINDQYVNTGNYLSSSSLTNGQTSTVDIASANTNDSDFIFDSSDPAGSEFTTGATHTFTAGMDSYNGWSGSTGTVFDMLGGHDYAHLGSGNDKVSGGSGNDIIRGGAGDDLLYGGADNDRIFGGDDDDTIYGGTGADRLYGQNGHDEIHGGAGNDKVIGHAGNDVLTGGAGDDKLNGGAGNDYLYGGGDDDTLIGGAGDDTLDGGAGADILHGGGGNNFLDGGDGDDIIVGGNNDDTINGGDNNDIIYASLGASFVAGAAPTVAEILADNPNLTYNSTTGNFYEFVNNGTTNTTYATALSQAAANTVNGVSAHLATITSSSEHNTISGIVNGGVYGWIGMDDTASEGTFRWNAGPEAGTLVSGFSDWYGGGGPNPNSTAADNVLFLGDSWGDAWYVWTATNSAWGYVAEWEGADVIAAATTSSIFSAGGSATEINILNGGAGDDTIYGSIGSDTLVAGTGNDVLYAGAGDDVLSSTETETVTMTQTVAEVLSANPNLTYNATTGNFYEFVSTGAADTTYAEALADASTNTVNGVSAHLATITSASENATVAGLVSGSVYGWIGMDDTASEGTFSWNAGPESGTTLSGYTNWYTGSPYTNSAANDHVMFLGSTWGGTWYVYGGGNNIHGYIAEWEGADVLATTSVLSNTTTDTAMLYGGDGLDTLIGGAGIDTFVFEDAHAYNNVDEIIDFVTGAGGDKIDISDLLSGFSGPITNWLNFVDSGSDTLIQVDANGTAGGSSFTTVGQINDLTGLDEATLYADGNIIV